MEDKKIPEIGQFDNLSITDLTNARDKDLLIAIYMKIKQINGKVKFHDWFVKATIGTVSLGVITSVIIAIVLYTLHL
jgi:hypothetical protein